MEAKSLAGSTPSRYMGAGSGPSFWRRIRDGRGKRGREGGSEGGRETVKSLKVRRMSELWKGRGREREG